MNQVITSARWVLFSVFMGALFIACGGGGSGNDSINAVRSVNVSVPNANTIAAGDTRQLSASVTFDDGGTADVSEQVVYSTPQDGGPASAQIISIDDSGVLSALRAGSTTLTATFDGVSQTRTINVAAARLESISITAQGLMIQNGQRRVFENATGVSFTARGTFSDGSSRDLTNARFTSSNTNALSFASATSGNATIGSVAADSPVTVTASQDGKSRAFALTVLNDAITSIAVRTLDSNGGIVVPATTTNQLNAFATTTSGREINITSTAQWAIPNSSVATVGNGSTGGLVRGVARGSTTLTASQDNVSSPAATITVTATLVSIRISPDSDPVNSPAGIAQLFKAFGTFSDGAPEERLSDVTWSLENATPANQLSSMTLTTADTDSDAEVGDLQVTGSQEGASADVVASRDGINSDDGGEPVTFVTTAPLITAIQVTAPSTSGTNASSGNPTLPVNRDDQYTATATFSNQTTADVTGQVNWSSSNSGIATVDNAGTKGFVSGISVGNATITAVASNPSGSQPATVSGSIVVEVTAGDPTAITISIVPGDRFTRVAPGFNLQFRATDSNNRDVSNEVLWFTSVPESIATIDQTGRLTAVSTNNPIEDVSVQAQVESNSVGDSLNITIEDVTLFEIVVEPADSQLPIGENLQYTATGSFTADNVIVPGTTPTTTLTMDLSDQVTWSALNPNPPNDPAVEATITQQGLATGVSAGDVQIQADCGTTATPQDECITAAPQSQRISGDTGLEVTDVVVRDLFLSTITAANGAVCQSPTPADANATDEPECFASVARGLNIQLRARAVFSDGTVNENYQSSMNISFSAVTSDGSPCANVTVSNAAGSRGRVTGEELGNCQITAVATNPSTDADDAETADRNVLITVTDEVLQQICVEPAEDGNNCATNVSVNTARAAGVSVQYRARGTFSNGSTRLLTSDDQLSWSANPAMGVVDITAAGGLVTGLTEGVGMTAQIIATAQSASGSQITSGASDFLVNAATLVSVTVTPNPVSQPASTGSQLTATARFTDGSNTNVTTSNSTVWSSGNSAAVTVSNASGAQGRIFASGSADDTAVITATYTSSGDTQSGTSDVTVTDGLVTAITVTPADASVAVNGSQQYTATAQRSDGTSDDISGNVTWSIVSTGDGGAASITPAGNATGTAAGTVRVFARFTRADGQRVSGNTQLTINSDTP